MSQPIVALNNVSKVYRTDKIETLALSNINLEVARGEFLSIMGPSGSGKSTLMNILGCLDVPTGGLYELNGQRVSDMDDDELVFELPEVLRPIYQDLGIDIPAYNGDDSFMLPVPATYIVRQDGIVAHAFVNADYTQRMEPAEIVSRLGSFAAAA